MARDLLTATPANAGVDMFWRRLGASAIDLALCVIGPFIGFGLLANVLPERYLGIWIPAIAVAILGYVSLLSAHGATLGMRLLQIRLQRSPGSGPPGLARGFLRGVIALLGAASGIVVLAFGFSDASPAGSGEGSAFMTLLVTLVFAVSVLGRLWLLIDREQRTLFDHLLGVTVVPADGRA